jgi:hypothetical protein
VLSEANEDEEIPKTVVADQDHTKLEIFVQDQKVTECPSTDAISRKKLRKKLQKKR